MSKAYRAWKRMLKDMNREAAPGVYIIKRREMDMSDFKRAMRLDGMTRRKIHRDSAKEFSHIAEGDRPIRWGAYFKHSISEMPFHRFVKEAMHD